MKLRNAFLYKMTLIALVGLQLASVAKAADWHQQPTFNPQVDSSHGSDNPFAEAGFHEYGLHGEGDGGMTMADFQTFTKKHIQDMAQAFSHNPHQALNKLIELANHSFAIKGNGTSKFKINLKYIPQMPMGDTTIFELTTPSNDQVITQLSVHSAAKTNPYFLLDALTEIKNIYGLDNISASHYTPIYAKKAHPSHPDKIHSYHYGSFSLLESIGIPAVSNTGENVIHNMFSSTTIDPMLFLEMKANAEGGSVFAQRRLAEMEINNFQLVKRALTSFAPIKKLSPEAQKSFLVEYAKAKGVTLSAQDSLQDCLKKFQDQVDLANKKRIDNLNIEAKKQYLQGYKTYKDGAEIRDQLVNTKSLSEMVKANDRPGVAKAMEIMLPWSLMEPTEKSYWTGFVDAIRNPNYKNAAILFRGTDSEEKIQNVIDSNGKNTGIGLFSKRLTAGSGSHLFKLRGLPETFETFGTSGVNDKKRISPLTEPHTLTKMMINHSNSPSGSPFISLTYSLSTAMGFSTGATLNFNSNKETIEKAKAEFVKTNQAGGLATIRMDPRRVLTNSISTYIGELEVLASMFIFPDEVIYFERGVSYSTSDEAISDPTKFAERNTMVQTDLAEYYARARAAVYQKTGTQMPESYLEVKTQGQKQFIDGIKNLETLFDNVAINKPKICEGVFK